MHIQQAPTGQRRAVLAAPVMEPELHGRSVGLGAFTRDVHYMCSTSPVPTGLVPAHWMDFGHLAPARRCGFASHLEDWRAGFLGAPAAPRQKKNIVALATVC